MSLEMERERGVVMRVLDPGPEPGLGPPDDPVGRLKYPEPMLTPTPISGPVSCCFRPRSCKITVLFLQCHDNNGS